MTPEIALAEDRCVVCNGAPMGKSVFIVEDKVTHQKVEVCEECEKNFKDCFICGVPANTNTVGYVELADGRALCARDAKTAVLQEESGHRIYREVHDSLEKMFVRFTDFPDTNITVEMVDRVHLQELFTLAGNDYHCPNILGYTRSETNHNQLQHRLSFMTALPHSWFQAVCAHELTHAWVAEHLSASRRAVLAREAEEGFCELVAFLFADSRDDQEEKAMILRNTYTRGQIDLFVAAHNSYGLNDVLDWMKYGTDARLSASDPARVHKVNLPRRKAQPAFSPLLVQPQPPPTTLTLVLKAVFWDQKHPLALVNDRTFALQEEGKVRLGDTNVTVRCLGITPHAVRVQIVGTGEERELVLKDR
jgi:hypothetical protein